MNVSLKFCLTIGFSLLLAVINSESISPITHTQIDTDADGYFVQLDTLPQVVAAGNSTARVRYQCPKPCEVGLEVVLISPQFQQLIFKRTWTSIKNLGTPRVRTVPLKILRAIIYQPDYSHPHYSNDLEVHIRAWLAHTNPHDMDGQPGKGGFDEREWSHGLLAHVSKLLWMIPPADHPALPHAVCSSWGSELMWQLTRRRMHKCPHESDVMDLMVFPLACTGENFGVVRTFKPFLNKELEGIRCEGIEQPRLAVSVWIYLLNWCSGMRCSIVKHMTELNSFSTPSIMLTDTGNVVVQVELASRVNRAFTAHTSLPIQTWIRLDCLVQYSQVTLEVNYETESEGKVGRVHLYDFHENVLHNDTAGHFVIGGSRFMASIHGYIGQVRYYRLGTELVINPLSPLKVCEELDHAHWGCVEEKLIIAHFMDEIHLHWHFSPPDSCLSYYMELLRRFGQKTCAQTVSWDVQRGYQRVFNLIKTHEDLLSGGWDDVAVSHLGSLLFEDSLSRIANGEPETGTKPGAHSPVAQLKVSSCLGHHQATLLLAAIHLAGFGLPQDLRQGHVFALMGAAADDRLSLLHMGYKHAFGLDGFPQDVATAYHYYSNIGRQTSADKEQVDDSQQYNMEAVHISVEEELESHMGETVDLVHYLQLQAERGDLEAQRHLAKTLFWGLNGMVKDVAGAVRWFAESALQMTDANAMYDYSILLIKGQGVKKNVTLGLHLMEKAAAMGSAEALNGLGWYYSTIKVDHERARNYFLQAAHNGSSDGIFNLGVYHLQGHPMINETAAFECFLRAAVQGHVDGTLEAAHFLTAGSLPGVSREPEQAVMLLKRISEQNGHLGYASRTALQAYLQGSRKEALVRYTMLAETGLEVAQSNAAYLCEELKHGSVCQWRYYNYSISNYDPHFSGLLRVAKHYVEGDDITLAIEMFGKAASIGSPEGMYTLAVLIEEGWKIPLSVRNNMRIPAEMGLDNYTMVKHLLERCVQLEEEKGVETLGPCALALLRINIQTAWRRLTADTLQLTLVYGMLAAILISVLSLICQTALGCVQGVLAQQRDNSEGHMGAPLVRSGNAAAVRLHPSDRHVLAQMDARPSPGGTQSSPADSSAERRLQPGGLSLQPSVAQAFWSGFNVVVTLTGVFFCTLGTMLLSHLLRGWRQEETHLSRTGLEM